MAIAVGPTVLQASSLSKGHFLTDGEAEVTSSPSKAPVKTIKFSRNVEYRDIDSDYTEDEIQRIWYSPDDYRIIKCMCKVTLRMMLSGVVDEEDPDFCARGLEMKTPEGARTRYRIKQRVRDSILDEQEEQHNEGIIDNEKLARISYELSSESRKVAHARGLRDESDVYNKLQW